MTESQIERTVEKRFDSLDARLVSGQITQATYEREAQAIGLWADIQYAVQIERNFAGAMT